MATERKKIPTIGIAAAFAVMVCVSVFGLLGFAEQSDGQTATASAKTEEAAAKQGDEKAGGSGKTSDDADATATTESGTPAAAPSEGQQGDAAGSPGYAEANGPSSAEGVQQSSESTQSSSGQNSNAQSAGPAADSASGNYCTLYIEAGNAGTGVVLSPVTVSFLAGETVFDVLQRECQGRGIHMEFTYNPLYSSSYIEGIANLYEFDRGELSGWMYEVNGQYPNYGCSSYVLSNGDAIGWHYTCDLGNDLPGAAYVSQG